MHLGVIRIPHQPLDLPGDRIQRDDRAGVCVVVDRSFVIERRAGEAADAIAASHRIAAAELARRQATERRAPFDAARLAVEGDHPVLGVGVRFAFDVVEHIAGEDRARAGGGSGFKPHPSLFLARRHHRSVGPAELTGHEIQRDKRRA